jgi:hypothetical protein
MRLVYKVLCLNDEGHYIHATSQDFNSRVEAATYMIPIDKGRKPVIVATGSK